MKKLFIILLLPFVLFAKGKIGVSSNVSGAYIYVDGKKKAMVGEGYTDINVDEGDRVISVEKLSDDGEWLYKGKKKVFVGEDTYTKININAKATATKKREERIAKEEAEELADKQKKEQSAWNALKSSFGNSKDGRFYRSSKGVVYDSKLKLLWQDDDSAKYTKRSWSGAKSYCSSLSLAGFSDWRLPAIRELLSITDLSTYKPAIKVAFRNTKSDYYWSSTSNASDSSYAWGVRFDYGSDGRDSKSDSSFVRCVR